ncbi:hypothetical protein GCM10010211_34790 [Streptomyces albospinus]|uniref:Acetyltransferase n=1 Tax=Streptomyces albospinus TaxID=285515 RepID=A0ABQ2V4G2_9ACTN|nr:hypothetical protein GCM10010211_34790 [Streptomyces albospinus]
MSRAEVAAKDAGRRRPEVAPLLVLAEGVPVGYAQYWRGDADGGGLGHGRAPQVGTLQLALACKS